MIKLINLRKDLIDEELKHDRNKGFEFSFCKLSNKFIDWLFRHYYIHEVCENFYDDEPDYDDEEFNMYMDYCDNIDLTGMTFYNIVINSPEIESQKENFRYSKLPHTKEELKAAYDKILQMRKDYEPRRIEFCNWQEPYFKGNWGMSQEYVNNFGRRILNLIKKEFPTSIKNRLYYAKKDNIISIYFYGRDLWNKDYWFTFMKRNENPRRVKRSNSK